MAPEHFPLELHMLKKTSLNFQNELFQKKSNQGGGGKGNTFLKNLEFSGKSLYPRKVQKTKNSLAELCYTPWFMVFAVFHLCLFGNLENNTLILLLFVFVLSSDLVMSLSVLLSVYLFRL